MSYFLRLFVGSDVSTRNSTSLDDLASKHLLHDALRKVKETPDKVNCFRSQRYTDIGDILS
jgi:hypothetical protein